MGAAEKLIDQSDAFTEEVLRVLEADGGKIARNPAVQQILKSLQFVMDQISNDPADHITALTIIAASAGANGASHDRWKEGLALQQRLMERVFERVHTPQKFTLH